MEREGTWFGHTAFSARHIIERGLECRRVCQVRIMNAADATHAIHLGRAWSKEFGRDLERFSTRNSSKGALVTETHIVFHALASGKSLAQVRSGCLTGTILRQRAQETRQRVWDLLHWRFFAWQPPRWVLADLAAAAHGEMISSQFVGLLVLHYARRDRLTFEFVADNLWTRWKTKSLQVRRDDVLDFLTEHESREMTVRKWSESTRKKLAGNLLSALRDFGLLSGVQRKSLQRPVVAPAVVLHLCRLLYAEGLRGRSLLEARDWRLFLWEPHDTAFALGQLAQQGKIRFERSGRTVVLDVPRHPLGEAA